MENKTFNLENLKKEIPYQWRVQSFSKNKPSATCVAYIDARDVMDLLDESVGAENWQDKFELINGQLFCSIGILVNGVWVWKTDTGTESQTEKEKGLVSDAFKRAAVKWGAGRFLYSLDIQFVDANEVKTIKPNENYPYVIDGNKKRVYNLTKFINDKLGLNQKLIKITDAEFTKYVTCIEKEIKKKEAIEYLKKCDLNQDQISILNDLKI